MVYITSKVYQEIASFLGAKEAERGAILLGKDNLVSGIYFEDATTVNPYNFTPVFTNFSNTENVLGLVHSHPFALTELSNQDIFYIAKQQFKVSGTKSFFCTKNKTFHFTGTTMLFFIVTSNYYAANNFEIFPYVYDDTTGKIKLESLKVI